VNTNHDEVTGSRIEAPYGGRSSKRIGADGTQRIQYVVWTRWVNLSGPSIHGRTTSSAVCSYVNVGNGQVWLHDSRTGHGDNCVDNWNCADTWRRSPIEICMFISSQVESPGDGLVSTATGGYCTVVSNSAANHQLYANDTQLLLSFLALDFSHNITHLGNTISNVSSWISSNFLSLNPSKTEFLIFGLPQQLSKLNNPTIHLPHNVVPVDSARNLGCIKKYVFAQHISAVSTPCFPNILDLRRIRNTFDQTTACTIVTSLIHSKIDYYKSFLLYLSATQSNRRQLVLTLLLVLTPKLLNFITLLLF